MKEVPEIRFKGFEDTWEKHKLYDLAEFNPKAKIPDVFEYVDLESVTGTEMKSHRTETKESAPSRAQRLAKKGDIFFQTVRPYQKNNFLFLKNENNYVFSTGYAQIRPYINSLFLMSTLQKDDFVNDVLNNCTGTSYPAINSKKLSSLCVTLPKQTQEQNKIGEFLNKIDHIINNYGNKIDFLKKYKELMLSKMFPKDGCDVPEVRFKGFSEKWNKEKFSNFIERRSEIDNDKFSPHIEYEDIISGEGCLNKDVFSKHSEKSGIKFNKNDILFGKLRPYLKNYLIANFSGIAVGDFWVLFSKNCSTKFIYYLIQTSTFQNVSNQSVGTKMPRSDWKLVSNYEFYIPKNIDEQIKIELYLEKIDSTCLKFTNKLKIVKKIKHSLLSKMFI